MINMERKIGEVFKFNGELIVAVEDIVGGSKCKKCYLYDLCRLYPWNIDRKNKVGCCDRYNRADNKSVVFKKVNDMEQKSIKIYIPEGYEIDMENSSFEEIKFKPIKKQITYDDVTRNLFDGNNVYYLMPMVKSLKLNWQIVIIMIGIIVHHMNKLKNS